MNTKFCFCGMIFLVFPVLFNSTSQASGPMENDSSSTQMMQMVNDKGVYQLPEMTVICTLNAAREQIVPSLGATKRTLNASQIEIQPQGDNASFDQTLYRFPGVVQDELDKRLHVRGEEANLQYRINDVLLPDGLLGFGQELSPKFVNQLSLIVGTLPAQYGGRTAGIIDIHTKNGSDMNGGDVTLYGGSYNTITPSFEYGNSQGKFSYYVNGGFSSNTIGMANPTSSLKPLHDQTYQYKGFTSLSYVIDNSSRFNFILSGDHSDFQLPNTPGQTTFYQYDTLKSFESTLLNENQNEQSYYEIAAYQKMAGRLNFQLSQTARYNDVVFQPDKSGDLMFNGVAARADHNLIADSFFGDISWQINGSHTVRTGGNFTIEKARVNTFNWVFPATWNDTVWQQTDTIPISITDDNSKRAFVYSYYLQDEWKPITKLTINYGVRFEGNDAYLNEYQFSPRINAVFQPTKSTTVQAGYGRYFTPPPLEFVPPTSIAKFNGTTYAANPNDSESSPVKSERYDYFDAGIVQQILPRLDAGIDGYYKLKKYVLDEGQFGPAMIFSPNNADHGFVRGVELTLNYEGKRISAFANVAFSRAMAYGLISGQFQFDPDELAYLQSHWYHLDHDQDITASFGTAYKWKHVKIYADALYGSGLYGGFGNTQELPQYITVNTGVEYTLNLINFKSVKARFDIVNVFDNIYEIRDGEGIGVFAPQYLPRRGFYGSLTSEF